MNDKQFMTIFLGVMGVLSITFFIIFFIAQVIVPDKKANDEVIEDKGVKVFIDPAAIIYLLGTEMDYKKEKFSSQFIFKNPNETERCGCGESFKV